MAEWHAKVPLKPSTPAAARDRIGEISLALRPSKRLPPAEEINAITPGKITPNVWTVMQKWVFALPTTTEAEIERKESLQRELRRTVGELGDTPGLGRNGVCLVFSPLSYSGAATLKSPPAHLLSLRPPFGKYHHHAIFGSVPVRRDGLLYRLRIRHSRTRSIRSSKPLRGVGWFRLRLRRPAHKKHAAGLFKRVPTCLQTAQAGQQAPRQRHASGCKWHIPYPGR
jgi:hypothetical protein